VGVKGVINIVRDTILTLPQGEREKLLTKRIMKGGGFYV